MTQCGLRVVTDSLRAGAWREIEVADKVLRRLWGRCANMVARVRLSNARRGGLLCVECSLSRRVRGPPSPTVRGAREEEEDGRTDNGAYMLYGSLYVTL